MAINSARATPSPKELGRAGLSFDAVLFDLDGVVTRTADVHAKAWKQMFDEFLCARAVAERVEFEPFDASRDYLAYVDGKPREVGLRSFLTARGITLREGTPEDPSTAVTIHGLAARKDALFRALLRHTGVGVYASTVNLVRALRARGLKTAVVTSSRNGRDILRVAELEALFDARVDGLDADRFGLRGKPNPDQFLRAAELLDVPPERAIVFEDATAGVQAGRAGNFALVVGVDRGGNRAALLGGGADFVVADLSEVSVERLESGVRKKRTELASWRIEQEGFEREREHEMESLFTVGNGYLGVRGALDTPLPGSYADLFVAGVYDARLPQRPYSELEVVDDERGDTLHVELVALPFPFRVRVSVGGTALDLSAARWRAHQRTLDMRDGVLHAKTEYETDVDRRVVVSTRRAASLVDVHVLLQELSVRPLNHAAEVDIEASLDLPDLVVEYPHVRILEVTRESDLEIHRFSTLASGVEICIVSRLTAAHAPPTATRVRLGAALGEPVTVCRYVVVYTSLDTEDPRGAAVKRARSLGFGDFEEALAASARHWGELWRRADVQISGSPATEQALRFNAYHLTIAADHDRRTSVGARALSGRAYEGHVFWDTEIFMFPFYLYRYPDRTRCLLLYRHRTLEGARRRARAVGCRGACFAWESTVTGDDVTPRLLKLKTTGKEIPIFTGTQQIHINADIAYAIWNYWEATEDREFMRDAGVELLLETARFWATRAERGPEHYHVRNVVGPDEYHYSVNDNAYTNWMARFNLDRAWDAAEWMQREYPKEWSALASRLELSPSEQERMRTVARELFLPMPNADGVIEECEGFFGLDEYLPENGRFTVPVSRLFEIERINRMKLVKQADVLMLLHLFPDAFPESVVLANYRYYEPKTDHASSLSPGIHAAVAARLGLRDDATRYFHQSLSLDLSNHMGSSALGVHLGGMGATFHALLFGFLGVRFDGVGPVADARAASRLPARWRGVSMNLAYRGQLHRVHVTGEGGAKP